MFEKLGVGKDVIDDYHDRKLHSMINRNYDLFETPDTEEKYSLTEEGKFKAEKSIFPLVDEVDSDAKAESLIFEAVEMADRTVFQSLPPEAMMFYFGVRKIALDIMETLDLVRLCVVFLMWGILWQCGYSFKVAMTCFLIR